MAHGSETGTFLVRVTFAPLSRIPRTGPIPNTWRIEGVAGKLTRCRRNDRFAPWYVPRPSDIKQIADSLPPFRQGLASP
jgi:hypothetical protein